MSTMSISVLTVVRSGLLVGMNLIRLSQRLKNTGILFHFKMGGGNVTKGKDGWWFK